MLGVFLCGTAAKCVDITLPIVTLRDVFASSALSGLLAGGSRDIDSNVELSFRLADKMLSRRNK